MIPSKFENTQGNEYELNSKKLKSGKIIPDLLMIYWLNDKIVSCTWKHQVKPDFYSNNDCLVYTPCLNIYNDRNKQDYALLRENMFDGMQTEDNYPNMLQGTRYEETAWWKKGD